MMRIAADKALPFEPLTPNAETIDAIKAGTRGELTVVGGPQDLLASLNVSDQVHQALQEELMSREVWHRRQRARKTSYGRGEHACSRVTLAGASS